MIGTVISVPATNFSASSWSSYEKMSSMACGSADASFTISTPMLEPWHGAFSTAGSPIFSTIRAAISSTVISLLCTAIYSDVGSPAAFSIFFV